MKSKLKQCIIFLMCETLLVLVGTTVFFRYTNQHLELMVLFAINITLIAAIHSVTTYIFSFPFSRQYPDNSERNIQKNNRLRFIIMVCILIYSVFFLKLISERI